MFRPTGMRHFKEKLSESYKFRPHQRHIVPGEIWTEPGMKSIIENFPIVKPKVERIGGKDDFDALVGGNQVLQKYNGVK